MKSAFWILSHKKGPGFDKTGRLDIRVEPDTRLKRVSGTDKALLPVRVSYE